jgi:hypothetical protein
MKQAIINIKTNEVYYEDIYEIFEEIEQQAPTLEERLQALEQLELERMFEL